MDSSPLRVVPWIVLALVGALAFCIALAGCGNSPGAQPGADGGMPSGDQFVQHNLDVLNQYRAQQSPPAAALALDDQLSSFALTGSQQLMATNVPHQHFKTASASGAIWTSGFCNTAGENQAPGWPASSDSVELGSIDDVLAQMMAEGPGGGHHDNIVSTDFARVGIALVVQNGQLWLTNDFSGPCP
ncbi:MAG TPA: CAP domain-containing protein [Polyangia bacterium]|nr:CAP domain-containing protein [Polyangia bacterium]